MRKKILPSLLLFLLLVPAALAISELKIMAAIFGALFFVLIFGILHLILQAFMLVDCFKREFDTKFRWLILLSLVPFAPVFYYFRVKKANRGKMSLNNADKMGFASAIVAVCCAAMWINFGVLGGIVAVILSMCAKKKDVYSKVGMALGITAFALQVLFFIAYFGIIFLGLFAGAFFPIESSPNWTTDIEANFGDLMIGPTTLGATQDDTCIEKEEFTEQDIPCIKLLSYRGSAYDDTSFPSLQLEWSMYLANEVFVASGMQRTVTVHISNGTIDEVYFDTAFNLSRRGPGRYTSYFTITNGDTDEEATIVKDFEVKASS
ncbi:MAG: hypothetical protein Q7S65_06085 [Nanoarchaeota archaeon]|nr:hypothetical protein [Nanoarchaeota archaeon]